MEIRKTRISDIPEISELHRKYFDKHHFTSHFSRNLLEKYFSSLVENNSFCYSLVDENKRIRGYLISGWNIETSLSGFQKKYFLRILMHLLIHPQFIPEKIISVITNLLSPGKKNELIQIYIIAVDTNYMRGAGKSLITFYEKELDRNKITRYGLSVRKNNNRAIKFYQNNGFIEISREKYSISYYKDLE
jgi:ribosomal protein S18 acetylase RimI-like enzyme